MNTDRQAPNADPIALPTLSDEAVVEIRNFIEHVLDRFDSHFAPQVRRFCEDRAEHNMVRPTLPSQPPTTGCSKTITVQCATPPGSNLAAFLFMHVGVVSKVEQRLADYRRLAVQRPSQSLIAGPSNWLITLSMPNTRAVTDASCPAFTSRTASSLNSSVKRARCVAPPFLVITHSP